MNYKNVLKKRAKNKAIRERLDKLNDDYPEGDKVSAVVKVALGLMVVDKHGSKRLKRKVLRGLD